MKTAALCSRNPVKCTCIALGSIAPPPFAASSRNVNTYRTTTSSSIPRSSVTRRAIHGFMTSTFTLRMSILTASAGSVLSLDAMRLSLSTHAGADRSLDTGRPW
eukprot:29974-Pelagococcus_subviridis.AAC.2